MALKSSRRAAIDPFIVMEVMRAANERAAAGGDVIHMEVGQPSTAAPRLVREAARKALESDLVGYTDALGLPALRRRIAQHYRAFYDVEVPAARIAVTTGSSGGFLLAFLAAFDPGDRVALAMPGYPCYRHILTALGIEPVLLPDERCCGHDLLWMGDAESAARLRGQYGLKLPDAIQLASALAINADALVTHDRDFGKVRGLRILT